MLLAFRASALDLMPMPAQVSPGQGRLKIDAAFTVAVSGSSDRRLEAAALRLIARMARQTGIPIPMKLDATAAPTLRIDCPGGGSEYPSLGDNESYRLQITATGARLSAPETAGALRGMETFVQLVSSDAESFGVPVLQIDDKPRFPWRGLMIDVARHWMPLAVIERNLDAMAAVKFNVFHWHLSDDQGFRVESRVFPKLQQLASGGNFYTQDEVRHIVAYARDRGIRVIPEFEMPGHATALLAAYPELASAPGPYRIECKWGIFEPTLDPSREEVYTFLDAFIGEMSQLFADECFHIGGDEVLDTQWKRNSAIQAFASRHALRSSQDLHAYFNMRVQTILKKHGRTMIGWDEILNPSLAREAVIQSWRGQQSLAEAAKKGYRGILSFGYYLDHMNPAAFHYGTDPIDGQARDLSAQETARILGGEACLWSEYASSETVDSRIWPRAAAIAERLWSSAALKDTDSMYRRMEAVSRNLDWVGVTHHSNYVLSLERLAGDRPAGPVRELADAVEATGIDFRQAARKYTSATPLNRLADAARPESENIRRLELIIRRFIADPAGRAAEREQIRWALLEWRDNHARLLPALESEFLLRETSALSEGLSQAGSIGLEALAFLAEGKPAPEDWLREKRATLSQLEKPAAEVTLAAVRPVRLLLESAVSGGAQAKAPPPGL